MALGLKEILEFVKVEHTLFSLPFVFIGAFLTAPALMEYHGDDGISWFPGLLPLFWILVAAVGARGLAMALNRIIDREIDASNPRTASRHLASGSMSISTAWGLCTVFLAMLVLGAWQLNTVALQLAWLPVVAFVIYPYLKRSTWLCHLWLGVCLGLAPAGAWLGIVGGDLGWEAIAGLYWYPDILLISLGVMLWITAFDLGYALMDVDNDLATGIHSFPSRFGMTMALRTAVGLTATWLILLILAHQEPFWIVACIIAAVTNIRAFTADNSNMDGFQRRLFRTSVSTGWLLLAGLLLGMMV